MEEKVYEVLDKLNIEYELVEHPKLFTYADNEKYGVSFKGTVCKNLFLRNKDKSKYYLVVVPLERKVDLKVLQEKLKETRLSFGDEAILEEKLKIKSGTVSILNIVNVEKTDIIVVLDEDILNHKKVGFHPNVNTVTVMIEPNDIKTFLDFYNVIYKCIDLLL